MFKSLKAKFTIAFGTLVVMLFASSGLFLINSKENEIALDIANTSQSYARLTAGNVVNKYQELLEPGNFIPFSREINSLLRRNLNISDISITEYTGELLYSFKDEENQQYKGETRLITDEKTLNRIQAFNISLDTSLGRTIYVKLYENGNQDSVDLNEDKINDLGKKERIMDIIVPIENSYAVIYKVSYDTLEERLATARLQIVLVASLGLLLTLVLSFGLSTSITRPIASLKEGALKIATGDFKHRVPVKSKDEVGVLAETFNKMAGDLEVSTKAMVYKERVAKELELAVQIQQNLLPKDKLILDDMDIAGGLIPATEVGGDAFDYIEVNDSQFITYLGDVTGHGVAAGIVSSIVNSLVYAYREKTNLIELIRDVNSVIRKKISSKVFFTMALTLWDKNTKILTYVNAGHPPVLYYDSATKKVNEIKIQGMALGMIADVEKLIQSQEIKMKTGDVFVMYSDGIVEANDLEHKQFGIARLKKVVEECANAFQAAESIKNTILAEVIKYINGGESLDDMTVVVLKAK